MIFELSDEDYADLGRLLRECRTRNFNSTSERWRGISRRIEKGLKAQLEEPPYARAAAKWPPDEATEEGLKFMVMTYGDFPDLNEEGRAVIQECMLEAIGKAFAPFEAEKVTPIGTRLRVEKTSEVPW